MKLQLGEKIKELRKRDGRKQEDLAVAFGVSPQAVSRWESGGGYPDMELLPTIANYFHVSIDELFGYDDEREERIASILSEGTAYKCDPKKLEECVDLLRRASEEFPSEPQIWLELGYALSGYADKLQIPKLKDKEWVYTDYDTEYNAKNAIALEAIEVLEKLLSMDIGNRHRTYVILILVNRYVAVGMNDKAEALAQQQAPIDCSSDFLRMYAAPNGELRHVYSCELIMGLLRMLKLTASVAIGSKWSMHQSENSVRILQSIADVYHAIINDGNFYMEHSDLSDIYAICAVRCATMGNYADMMKYLDFAIDHREAYDRLREQQDFSYTCDLMVPLHYAHVELPESTMGSLKDLVNVKKLDLPEEWMKKLQKEAKYRKYLGL